MLLSAGVGLTPLTSMLNAIVRVGSGRPTWFIHGARNKREHAFHEHHRRVSEQHKNVNMHVRYSQPSPEDVAGADYDDEGHVEIELIKRLVPHKECDFYLCGPSPFMESVFGGLLKWGVHETRIHYEFFGPASGLHQRGKVSTRTSYARRRSSNLCPRNRVRYTYIETGSGNDPVLRRDRGAFFQVAC